MKTSAMERQRRAGLPEEPLIAPRRLFDARSATLVLVFSLRREKFFAPQLYSRQLSEQQYASVAMIFAQEYHLPEGGLVAESPIIAGGRLFCLLRSYAQERADGPVAIRSVGVGVVDLITRKTHFWARATNFFANELIGANDDGSKVFAVIGRDTPTADGIRVAYAIAELDVQRLSLVIQADLENPFH